MKVENLWEKSQLFGFREKTVYINVYSILYSIVFHLSGIVLKVLNTANFVIGLFFIKA